MINFHSTSLLVFILFFSIANAFAQKKQRNEALFEQKKPNQTNILFNNLLNDSSYLNFHQYTYYYNGGGVALADFNNDGLVDVFFTGNAVGDKLYQNLGNFKFTDKTPTFLEQARWSTGVASIDINNDGLFRYLH